MVFKHIFLNEDNDDVFQTYFMIHFMDYLFNFIQENASEKVFD